MILDFKHGCESNTPHTSLVYHQQSLMFFLLVGNHLIAHIQTQFMHTVYSD